MVIIIIVWVKALYIIASKGAFTEKNGPLSHPNYLFVSYT